MWPIYLHQDVFWPSLTEKKLWKKTHNQIEIEHYWIFCWNVHMEHFNISKMLYVKTRLTQSLLQRWHIQMVMNLRYPTRFPSQVSCFFYPWINSAPYLLLPLINLIVILYNFLSNWYRFAQLPPFSVIIPLQRSCRGYTGFTMSVCLCPSTRL